MAKKGSRAATEAFRVLRTLYQLTTDLFSSQNRQDLIFRILNNTIRLFAYQRAVLWSFDDRRPKLLGVSGQEDVKRRSPLAKLWKKTIVALEDKKTLQILDNSAIIEKDAWKTLTRKTSGFSVLWIPFVENGNLRAGLWLERWGDAVWQAGESEIMASLAQNFSLAWKQFNPKAHGHSGKVLLFQRLVMGLAGVAVVYLLYFQTISLRIVAPCEIIPKDPVMIAAPLEGVIKQVLVKPGDPVKKGDLLFAYEDRIIIQELKVAQKQVQIIKSQYQRARLKAFTDQRAQEKIRSLQFRLEQERIRLKMVESNTKYLKVRATVNGICMVDNPENWRGRPVQIGERVVMIFNPHKRKVKIFLPENDYIQFDREKPVRIMLNADPGSVYAARLIYVAPQTSKNPQGTASFIAEAELAQSDPKMMVGSKGSAVVYGERVRIGYWLLRKPLAGLRHLFRV